MIFIIEKKKKVYFNLTEGNYVMQSRGKIFTVIRTTQRYIKTKKKKSI